MSNLSTVCCRFSTTNAPNYSVDSSYVCRLKWSGTSAALVPQFVFFLSSLRLLTMCEFIRRFIFIIKRFSPHMRYHTAKFSIKRAIFKYCTSSGRRNRRKCRLRRLRVEFLENGLSEDHEILQLIGNNRPHKPAGYGVTGCFRLVANCN